MPSILDRMRTGWNAFLNNKDPSTYTYGQEIHAGYDRPDRMQFIYGVDRTFLTSVYTRMAIDVATCDIRHVRVNENDKFIEEINSDLNECFRTDTNLDQAPRAFFQDAVQRLFNEGCVAIVPTDRDTDPDEYGNTKIYELRAGSILEWYPTMIKVRLYNERTGRKEDIYCSKRSCAIVENPFYSIMNESNSTVKRLTHNIALLDKMNDASSSGKLDMIIQLPYVIRTESRKKEAEKRLKDIEAQLTGNKFGIAYTDGTERITQLNRPLGNSLLDQIKQDQEMLFAQLGLTQEIMSGTADEEAMLNYYTRTIEPVLSALVDEMKRKFLTKTARSQGQSIKFFRDPFKLVSVTNIATIADTFTRNAILSTNEVRGLIAMKPSDQPGADELRNKNINQSAAELKNSPQAGDETEEM